MSSCLCYAIISEEHNRAQWVSSKVLESAIGVHRKNFNVTAHRSLGLVFEPIRTGRNCIIIKNMGNDVHVTGCDFVLKMLAAGQMQIVFSMSTSARDRQECWGRPRDSHYSLHITLAKRKKKKKMVRNNQFPCSKKTPENTLTLYNGEEGLHFLRITVKILQELCVETRNWYMNGRNDKSGLSANSCPIASLRLTERFTSKGLKLLAKKRWYQICHHNFVSFHHKWVCKSMHFNILILAIKLIKEVRYTIPICCWFRRT